MIKEGFRKAQISHIHMDISSVPEVDSTAEVKPTHLFHTLDFATFAPCHLLCLPDLHFLFNLSAVSQILPHHHFQSLSVFLSPLCFLLTRGDSHILSEPKANSLGENTKYLYI